MPIYNYKGQYYNIPEEQVQSFEKDLPEAKKVDDTPFYLVDTNKYKESNIQPEQQPEQIQTKQPLVEQPLIQENTLFPENQKLEFSGLELPENKGVSLPKGKPLTETIGEGMKQLETISNVKSRIKEQVENKLQETQQKLSTIEKFEPSPFVEQQGEGIQPLSFKKPEDYKTYTNYSFAQDLLKDTQKIIDATKEKGLVKSTFKGFTDMVLDPDSWDLNIHNARQKKAIEEAVKKADKGEPLTDDEQELLDAAALNMATQQFYSSDIPRTYGWGQIAGQSVPFMVEMLLNPISGAGKGIAKSIAKYGIKRFGAKGAAKTALKAGARTVGDILAGLGMTVTSGAPKVAEDIAQQGIGNIDFKMDEKGDIVYGGHEGASDKSVVGKALQAIGSNAIEYQSEMLGASGLGKLLGKAAPVNKLLEATKATGFGKFVGKLNNSEIFKNLKGLEARAQWSGILGEYGEEVYGTLAHAAMGEEDIKTLTDVDKQVDTFMGLALTGGALSGINTVGYAVDVATTNSKLKELEQQAQNRFENWDEISETLKNTSVDERTKLLKEAISKPDLSPESKVILTDYLSTLTYKESLHGAREEVRKQDREKAAGNGIMLYEKAKEKDIDLSKLYNDKRELEEKLGDFKDVPLEEIEELPDASPDIIEAARKYDVVKNEFDTMMDSLKKDVDEYVDRQTGLINTITRDDGYIIEADLGDRRGESDMWYVVDGNIAFNDDGTIDKEKSDDVVVVSDTEGKKKQVSIDHIANVNVNRAEDVVETIKNEAYKTFIDPFEEKLEGEKHFNPGEKVEYIDNKGETVAGTVIDKQNNTVTILSNDGKKTQTYTEKDLEPRLVGNMLGDIRVRDEIPVKIGDMQLTAYVQGISDNKAELYIPDAPDPAQRYMDLTLEEINEIRVKPQAEQVQAQAETIKKSEKEGESVKIPAEEIEQKESETPVIVSKSQFGETKPAEETEQVKIEFPTDKEGQIDYDKINDENTYLQALETEFKDEPETISEIIETKKNEALDKFKQVPNEKDIIKRKRLEQKVKNEINFFDNLEKLYKEKYTKPEAQAEEKADLDKALNVYKPAPEVVEKYKKAPKVYGNEDVMVLPDGTQLKGKWVMTEADAVTPSHDPYSLQSSKGYPVTPEGRNINDNDYTNKRFEVESKASSFDARAIDNPIFVKDGIVISGNNRTMSSIIAAERGTDKKYMSVLPTKAKQRGIEENVIEQFKHPRLYFEVADDIPFTTETYVKFNQRETKAKNPLEKAIVQSKRTDENAQRGVRRITSILDRYDTLPDFYKNTSAQREVMKALLDTKLINENERPELQNDTGELTGAGRDFLESILTGSIIKEDQLKMLNVEGMKQHRQKIVKSIGNLLRNEQQKNKISDELNEAIYYLYDAREKGLDINELFRQGNVFEDYDYDPYAALVALKLKGKEKDFREFVEDAVKFFESENSVDMFKGRPLNKIDFYENYIQTLDENERKTIEFIKSRRSNKGIYRSFDAGRKSGNGINIERSGGFGEKEEVGTPPTESDYGKESEPVGERSSRDSDKRDREQPGYYREQPGGLEEKEAEKSVKEPNDYIRRTVDKWVDLYEKGEYEEIFDNDVFNNVYANRPIIKPFEERIGFTIPDISTEKAKKDFIKSLKEKFVKPETDSLKKDQYEIIRQSNPIRDDIHTGIRSEADILTAEEAFTPSIDENEDVTPDFTVSDMKEALKSGRITVYSSYPIENGVFVTPSKMEAQNYAGKNKVYSKKVPLSNVAWIDATEGQYAEIERQEEKKEPWQMTRKEFESTDDYKEEIIGGEHKNFDFTEINNDLNDKWVYTRDGGKGLRRFVSHKKIVQKALSEGKPVPPEVLKDYPDLEKGDYNERIKQLRQEIDDLIRERDEKFPNPDIESPMSKEEKELNKRIADKFSEINRIIKNKRDEQREGSKEAFELETEAIESASKAVEYKSKNVGSDKQSAGEVKEESDELIEQVEEQLQKIDLRLQDLQMTGRIYLTGGIYADNPINVLAKGVIKKDATKFVDAVKKLTGLQYDTNKKGKTEKVSVNIAPAGGDISFFLWSNVDPELGVYVSIPVEGSVEYDEYSVPKEGNILWRLTTKKNKYTGLENQWVKADITAGELSKIILNELNRKLAEEGKPEEKPEDVTSDKVNEKTKITSPEKKKAGDSGQKQLLDIKPGKPEPQPFDIVQKAKEVVKKDQEKRSTEKKKKTLSDYPLDEALYNADREYFPNPKEVKKEISGEKTTEIKEKPLSLTENKSEEEPEKEEQNERERTKEQDGRRDNSRAGSGREILPESKQVGGQGTPATDTTGHSQSKRGNIEIGGSQSGAGFKYDLSKSYSNEEIHEIVSSVTDIVDGKVVITGEVTDDIKTIAERYIPGGIAKQGRGVLDEYYTDTKIVDTVRDILSKYFNQNKSIRVLEPSVGVGNFIQAVPTNESEIVAFEINETTARIAKIFHPDIEVNVRSFETEFIDESGKKKPMPEKYDLVIGNPPYGEHRGIYKGLGEERNIAKYEDYFVKRSLDVLKENGMLAMVLPSGWMNRHKKEDGYRIEVAYRLPEGAFEATKIGTDIVVLKKDSDYHSTEEHNYFGKHPENILGEVKERKNRFGREEEYVEGDIDTAIEQIKANEAKRIAEELNIEPTTDNIESIENAIDETSNETGAKKVVKATRPKRRRSSEPYKGIDIEIRPDKLKYELNKKDEVVPAALQFKNDFSKEEAEAFKDCDYQGKFKNPEKHKKYANYYKGDWVHDFYYAEGNIYEKLEQLERDKPDMSPEQYEKQKKMLHDVLPKKKTIDHIDISPNTAFVKNLTITTKRVPEGEGTLSGLFLKFISNLPSDAFGDSNVWEVRDYVYNYQVYGSDKHRNKLVRERRKKVANDLFRKFITEELDDSERKQIEHAFNREYNAVYRPDYSKVPMFSSINKNFKGKPLVLTEVQRAGIGRMTVKGVGLLAHEVGFGKTLSGVLSVHEAMTRGFVKKPIIIVPNDSILKQWVETIYESIPNAKVNVLGNLGVNFDLSDFSINDGEYTIVTYEGFKAMGFNDETYEELASEFEYITDELKSHKSNRDKEKEKAKKSEVKGKMKRGTSYNFENFGFDYMLFDEVHNANHIVGKVKLDKKEASDFRSQTQRTSDLGIKTWIASQYIQKKNNGRNVCLLSATPFTNKPLEYYSILSLIANSTLKRMGFYRIDQFFETFMEAENDIEIKADGSTVDKTTVRRFKNNGLFNQLLSEFIDIKGEEDNPDLVRPNRHNKEYKVEQNYLTEETLNRIQDLLSDNDTVLSGITQARLAAFSPYASYLCPEKPATHKEFVENSPKIYATVKLIEQNIKDNNEAGQLIYSEIGIEFFPMIRDYLVKESGLKEDEVVIITGATSNKERARIQEAFNKGDVKIIIGSPAIKEGLNLQKNTTDMYILSLPYNFTQLRQVEGRSWRQGNKWKNIRINYMLTNDTVDVFMLQRLQVKQNLYNEAMKKGADSVDVGDINTEELKTALITNPYTRAQIEVMIERKRLEDEKTKITADLAFILRKFEKYNELKKDLEYQKEIIKKHEEWGKKDEWYRKAADRLKEKLQSYVENLKEEQQKLAEKGVNVDDIENQEKRASEQIKEIDKKIENLKEVQDLLVEKYIKENEEKARKKRETIDKFVSERAKENKNFYEKRKESDSIFLQEDLYSENAETYGSDEKVRLRATNRAVNKYASDNLYFSPVEKALDKIQQEKGTKYQFKAMLLKNGAKQAELDWMGFDELPEKLTKQDIQNWIDANRIEIEEVTKEKKPTPNKWFVQLDNGAIFEFEGDPNDYDEARKTAVQEAYDRYGDDVLIETLEVIDNKDNEDNTKFSYYKLPGGDNYTELLLTMKDKEKFIPEGKWLVYEGTAYDLHKNFIKGFDTYEDAKKFINENKSKYTRGLDFMTRFGYDEFEKDSDKYFSPHFEEQNILAHVRFDEREHNGEKILFIEEIQSDWAQEGKRKGFSTDTGQGVPDMPFKKTDQWVALVLRRMMRYAAENGFDRIAWTNGEQQAERYYLSKQVDEIKVIRNGDTYTLHPIRNNQQLAEYKNIDEKELDEYVGKDLASKIISDKIKDGETKSYSGLDLKVGGAGMKAFYDMIVPTIANKIAKPFGAKVETIKMDIGEQQSIPVTDKMVDSLINEGIPLFRTLNKRENLKLLSMQNRFDNPLSDTDKYHAAVDMMEIAEKMFKTDVRTVVVKGKREVAQVLRNYGLNEENAALYENYEDPIQGIYYKGVVILNSSDINSSGELFDTWIHEVMHNYMRKNSKILVSLLGNVPDEVFEEVLPDAYLELSETEKLDELFSFLSERVISGEELPDYDIVEKEIKPIIYNFLNEITNGRYQNNQNLQRGRRALETSYEDIEEGLRETARTVGERAEAGKSGKNDTAGRYGREGISAEREIERLRSVPDPDKLVANADNLRKAIPNYGKFLNEVLNGMPDKERFIQRVKETGFGNIDKAIEQYMAEVNDPKELERIMDLLGTNMSFNTLRYILWRNANPNDGTKEWKIEDARKRREFNDNNLFKKGEPPTRLAENEYEKRIRSRFNKGFKGLMYGIEEGYFDKMASLKYLQEAISGGKEIPEKENAYMLENQLSSRNSAEIAYYNKYKIEPMNKAAVKIFGNDLDAIDTYLIAKHGLERNDKMARREAEKYLAKKLEENIGKEEFDEDEIKQAAEELYEKLAVEKDYSGLTALAKERGRGETFIEAAQNIVEEVESAHSAEDINALWNAINDATKWILEKQFEAGIMSKETYENIRDMYTYYVPLRGFSETVADDLYEYIEHQLGDFNSVLKKAYGRTSRAYSPFAEIINMAESGILQANRNKMKQAFYRLIVKNPSNYATIKDVWYVMQGDEWVEKFPDIPSDADSKTVSEIVDNFEKEMEKLKQDGLAKKGRRGLDIGVKIGKAQASEHAVRVWVNGEEKVIYINGNPRAAQAINGLTRDMVKYDIPLVRAVQSFNRQMASNFTSRNPAFTVTNFMRDIQFAIMSSAIKEGGKYSLQLAQNAIKVIPTISKNLWGKGGGEFGKYWEEFLYNGGETGYANLRNIENITKELQKSMNKLQGRHDMWKPLHIYIDTVSRANRMIEDISRFATYVTSRQMGRSIERSVSDAKEITINFNRKGSGIFGADILHTFYLFANPALQSMRLLGLLAKKYPTRFTAVVSLHMAMGFMMPMLNQMLLELVGDDDDKEKYWNINEWIRRNHVVIYLPWTEEKFFTFMLSHEFRPFYGMGEILYAAASKNLRHENIFQEMVAQFSSILPIDPFTGSVNWWIPDFVKPVYEANVSNINFMGRPIFRDTDWNKLDPDWTKAYKSTPTILVEGAKWINEATGGDDVVKGKIDINPAKLNHIFTGYMGGFLGTYVDIGNVVFNMLTGESVTENQIPVVNKIIRSSDELTEELRINGEYFYYLDWMKDFEHKEKGYRARLADKQYVTKYRKLFEGDETRIYFYAKEMTRKIKTLEEIDKEKAMKLKREFISRMHEFEDETN